MSEWRLAFSHEELFRAAMKAERPLDAIRDVGAYAAKYRKYILCEHQYQSDGRCAFCWKVNR